MNESSTPAPAGTVLLHDSFGDDDAPGTASFLFSDAEKIITCRGPEDIERAFCDIEKALDSGCYVAGGFCYELGYDLEPCLQERRRLPDGPLFQLGVFRNARRLDAGDLEDLLLQNKPCRSADDRINVLEDLPVYDANVTAIKNLIFAGDIYQANYTFPLQFSLQGDIWDFYRQVSPFQKVPFGAVLDLPDIKCASFSPELFFSKTGEKLEARPMKGTMRRGETPEDDRDRIEFLRTDEKNRAENLMIVDLIRNDLGRLTEIGSVSVRDAFSVETYETLHQMTSTIEAVIRPDVTVLDIFRNVFPCGSVTGAPKIRAMEIIADLEKYPRGLYTGAIGYITPDRDMRFSVPIRTVCFDRDNTATLGIGSGIVADSVQDDEYDECLLKASFLVRALGADLENYSPPAGLIETMRSVDGDIPLLESHMERLLASAGALGIEVDEQSIRRSLVSEVSDMMGEHRLRLQLDHDGEVSITVTPLITLPENPVIIPARRRLNSKDPLRRYKSTLRDVYDEERKRLYDVPGGFDVLFLNERDEICEGGISNIFIELDGQMLTPPLSSGVLPGVMRKKLIGEWNARERALTLDDLAKASRVYMSNAVRGAIEVGMHGFD